MDIFREYIIRTNKQLKKIKWKFNTIKNDFLCQLIQLKIHVPLKTLKTFVTTVLMFISGNVFVFKFNDSLKKLNLEQFIPREKKKLLHRWICFITNNIHDGTVDSMTKAKLLRLSFNVKIQKEEQ